ncbi:MAG: hypothetical protein MUE53_07485 [Chitinophagales bacterium]|jgi:flagellin-specific chaperone FliS|nr:hypothetical protein [Chitinophagales bacterium]
MKYTEKLWKNLLALFELTHFKVRFEKGTFQSNACIILERKMILVNKFLDKQAKLEKLIEIFTELKPEIHAEWPEDIKKTYYQIFSTQNKSLFDQ